MPREHDDIGVGARLRSARLDAGHTILALATASGIHPATINRVEKGISMPTTTTLRRLARALSLDITELVA